MIKFYKKHGMLVYWLILLLDCYDSWENQSDNGYYIKGLLFLSAILFLVLNFNKRQHSTSKWIFFTALIVNVIGNFLILNNTTYTELIGYSLQGVTVILFIVFMLRLVRREELSPKEPIIIGSIAAIGGTILFVKSKADFGGFNYFVYAYALILCMMLAISVQLLDVKNKRHTTMITFIPAALLMCAAGVMQVILRISGDAKGLEYLKLVVLLCSGYSIALMINGAKKILK